MTQVQIQELRRIAFLATHADGWPQQSHLDALHERRTDEELEALLEERRQYVRARQ